MFSSDFLNSNRPVGKREQRVRSGYLAKGFKRAP